MLVYGDAERLEDPRSKLAGVSSRLEALYDQASGIARHAALVSAFIEASELAQGLVDAEFASRGEDNLSQVHLACSRLLFSLAGTVIESWRSGFAPVSPSITAEIADLAALPLPTTIRTKGAEGYAFYALYPESYAQAALDLAREDHDVVIGIRSIGFGLAAIVAAALGSPAPVSVRPVGHPFRRTMSIGADLAAHLLADKSARYLLVDEGPGLSGSSFGAVADWLEQHGVARNRIGFLPSHAGELGQHASDPHRQRWSTASRHVVDFDDLVLRATNPAHRLESWVADVCGPADTALEDLSGGQWRAGIGLTEEHWPGANVQQERRKYLLRAGGRSWLLKFAGLGDEAGGKLPRGRSLYAAGLAPEAIGFRHGFLVQGWIESATPLHVARVERPQLIQIVGRYLAHRAKHFDAPARSGASVSTLFEMVRHNTQAALATEIAGSIAQYESRLGSLAAQVHRVDTDNRMHAWEWLLTPLGDIIKTDALDHSSAHDLIGCQDIAWDVAGAALEFGLSQDEQALLCERVARDSGRRVSRDLLAFCRVAYLAYQLGAQHLAAQALVGWPAEAQRLRGAEERYRKLLEKEIGS